MKRKNELRNQIGKLTLRDSLLTLLILLGTTAFCILLQQFRREGGHAQLLFVFAVILVSRFTDRYIYGIIASVISVFEVNYIFTYPYYEVNFSLSGYPITFLVMLSVAVIVSMLTTQNKRQERSRMDAEREKMRANLLRAVSHDFRTPLTSIVGASSAILENHRKLSEEETLSLIKDIKEEAQGLVRVMENLLLVTRMDTTNVKLKKTPEMAEEVMAEAVGKLKKYYPDAPVSTKAPDTPLFIPMDAMLVEQVVLNLLENAVVHGERVSKIFLTVLQEGKKAVISVEDDGVGIDTEKMDELFEESSYRKGIEVVDRNKYMGIGLSVCMAIAKMHGGFITAKNKEEGGAVFSFYLPLEEDER